MPGKVSAAWKPSKAYILKLAMAIYAIHIHSTNPDLPKQKAWRGISDESKGRYLFVARKMLLNPPAVLRKAITNGKVATK